MFDDNEKENWKTKIEKGETLEDVQKFIDEIDTEHKTRQDAIDEAQRQLDEARKNGSADINALPNLSDDEKSNLDKKLNDAKTPDDVKKIVEDARNRDLEIEANKHIDGQTNDIL